MIVTVKIKVKNRKEAKRILEVIATEILHEGNNVEAREFDEGCLSYWAEDVGNE